MVFPEDVLKEVLLPDDQFGLYDIEHIKAFWVHQKAKIEAQSYKDNLQLSGDFDALKRKLGSVEGDLLQLEEYKARNNELETQHVVDS